MAKEQPQDTQKSLDLTVLQEMEALSRALEQIAPGKREEARLAVVRFFHGMPASQWEELADRFGLKNWMALPLNKDEFVSLDMLQAKIDQLVHQSNHDPLTGLNNRRSFMENMKIEIERARRLKSPMSLAMLDIDDFKALNDTYGHLCGDKVLVELASTIKNHIRKLDFAARLGGEEFGIILTGSGLVETQKVLERLKDKISRLNVYCREKDCHVSPTCSMGLACYKGSVPIDPENVIHEADKALYQAKEQGKNRIVSALLLGLAKVSEATLVKKEEKRFLFSK